ncbi:MULTISPECIES: fumarylacetoacetate hydrolase family protein [unclassified Amycolatopsis]|uniref:fumarylacetoacetate hydrolase family protein n=1 Tax=unclassified Amycolatopsis TaxID=2618356 RepID=UPI001C696F8E|nr:fumarylacetoacetate hydrolase family protein [Amycolatopsis sp. DSM 110486]QYN23202.1 fumarylacetoacetate hydrolase family protein [Amycolatopsis sp. DSM 110486]
MRLYRTTQGLARGEGDELLLLDVPHHDVAELLVDNAQDAAVRGRLPLAEATLLAPVAQPKTVVIVGANYAGHIAEAGLKVPTTPAFFPITPGPELFVGTGKPIVLPAEAPDRVDYEAELAVVLGAPAGDVKVEDAARCIAGFTVANDVSARDVQFRGMRDGAVVDLSLLQRAKGFPTFKPLGPVLVTPDELGDDLAVTTRVNGVLRQQGRTSEMLFPVAELVAAVSAKIPLAAGDVILTGTPAGVALASGDYLRAGDVVEVSVEGIGSLRNEVSTGGS